jgi:hypothetical protein
MLRCARLAGKPSRLPWCGNGRGCPTIAGWRRATLLAALALGFLPSATQACSVCFGNTDSKLSQGMLAGVLVLLLVVLAVLGGFVALFIFLARKAAAAAAIENVSPESKA